MVAVQLKGVHVVRMRLRSGKVANYHYAWRGGPRLPGEPGSLDYITAFEQAHRARKRPSGPAFTSLITMYRASPEFAKLSAHSQRAYRRYLDQIQERFGDMPVDALNDADVAQEFYEWRDSMARTPRTADYAVATLSRLLTFCKKRRKISENHAADIDRLHSVDRSDSIWTEGELEAFKRHASPELWRVVSLAALTGLRQSDLIGLSWRAYEAETNSILVVTSKTGKTATIPVTQDCAALLSNIPKRGFIILTTDRGKRPWTADGLRASFRKACARAGIRRTFHDLRRTAATRLLQAGCDKSQVAMIMGWSEDDVEALKRRYVSRKAVMDSVLAKLERDR